MDVCTIYNCRFFMMNSSLIKFYNNYTITHIQHFLKLFYIITILSVHCTSILLIYLRQETSFANQKGASGISHKRV